MTGAIARGEVGPFCYEVTPGGNLELGSVSGRFESVSVQRADVGDLMQVAHEAMLASARFKADTGGIGDAVGRIADGDAELGGKVLLEVALGAREFVAAVERMARATKLIDPEGTMAAETVVMAQTMRLMADQLDGLLAGSGKTTSAELMRRPVSRPWFQR